MIEKLQHLVLVRHGESEGDVRRKAWQQGKTFLTNKIPEEEELTLLGYEQSAISGEWIKNNILLGGFAIKAFKASFVSSVLRTEQSALAMDLPNSLWQEDPRLNERNRGLIKGITKNQHQTDFPASYQQMINDPIAWCPPEGESIIDVANKLTDFYLDIQITSSVIVAGHRDSMWAFMKPVEGLSYEQLRQVDTDKIDNGQIWHYTSIDPNTGEQAPKLLWKQSINPSLESQPTNWQKLDEANNQEFVN